jgi:two-component system phosphate regulon response regulator OmpR
MTASATTAAFAPHVLVVDDDTRLRNLLKRYLTEHGYRVTTAADADDALRRLGGLAFDLVVLDVMMPGHDDGMKLTRQLRKTSRVPVLLLTARGEPEDRIEGLEAGADDYLSKPFEPRELLLRVEAVLRRAGPPLDSAATVRLGDFEFHPERGELLRGGDVVRLTTAEIDLLRLFCRNPRSVLSRADLAGAGGGGGGDRAVDVHVTRLRRKIEPDPRNPRYLKTVWGKGYTLWPD